MQPVAAPQTEPYEEARFPETDSMRDEAAEPLTCTDCSQEWLHSNADAETEELPNM